MKDEDEIRLSVIIPFRDHESALFTCLEHLARQTLVACRFEVILVQDPLPDFGLDPGPDSTCNLLRKWAERTAPHLNFSVLKMALPPIESYFDVAPFRIGAARNAGAQYARGDRLIFFDETALAPPTFLEDALFSHDSADIIQYRRLSLRVPDRESLQLTAETAHEPFNDARPETSGEVLYEGTPWEKLSDNWKHLSFFCLSIRTHAFLATGGFPRGMMGGACEDAYLGWKLEALRLKWSARLFNVYSLQDSHQTRMTWTQRKRKAQLAADSARAFYFTTLDPSVYRVYFDMLGATSGRRQGRRLLRTLAAFPITRPFVFCASFILLSLLRRERRSRWPTRSN